MFLCCFSHSTFLSTACHESTTVHSSFPLCFQLSLEEFLYSGDDNASSISLSVNMTSGSGEEDLPRGLRLVDGLSQADTDSTISLEDGAVLVQQGRAGNAVFLRLPDTFTGDLRALYGQSKTFELAILRSPAMELVPLTGDVIISTEDGKASSQFCAIICSLIWSM